MRCLNIKTKVIGALVLSVCFCLQVSCNAGTKTDPSSDGNSNYLPEGSYIQKNGTMETILNGNNTPVYSYLCQSEVSYNITINTSGQRCIGSSCTANSLLIKQNNCFNSTQNPGTLPNLPGRIDSYSDSWKNCEYKSNYLTATRSVTIHATANSGPYTLVCTGNVTIYPN